jgi:hypothetical protein
MNDCGSAATLNGTLHKAAPRLLKVISLMVILCYLCVNVNAGDPINMAFVVVIFRIRNKQHDTRTHDSLLLATHIYHLSVSPCPFVCSLPHFVHMLASIGGGC